MKHFMIIPVIIVMAVFLCGCTTKTPAEIQPMASPTMSGGAVADANIPDLTGTWVVRAEGGSLLKTDTPGQYSHYVTRTGTLTATWVITAQQGRVIQANFTSATGKNESAIGVISMDNKNVYIADMDGFLDLHIIDNDTMTLVYRHVTASDSVASVGTWERIR